MKKLEGTHGRLEIPSLCISVRLFDGGGGTSQGIVDAEDSAAYMRWYAQDCIADHVSQAGFKNLEMAVPGKTVAKIIHGDNIKSYRCTDVQIGHIKELGDGKGRRVYDKDWKCAYYENEGGLCIYTCRKRSAEDVMDITLTYWQETLIP